MHDSYARALPRQWQRTALTFTALGDPHRQRILLMFEPAEELSVAQIVSLSPLSRTAVTHHLRVLREAGLLRGHRVGKEMRYRPVPDAVRRALDAVRDYLDQRFARAPGRHDP